MIWRTLAIGVFASSTAHAADIGEAPKPWFKNGAKPAVEQCDGGVDTALEALGTTNLTLKCDATVDGFVGVMQRLEPDPYRSTRVRFSAVVKTENVEGWGGLWMRVDDVGKPNAAFDNMQRRPIQGTTDWTEYAVVLDASANAQGVYFGTLMTGKGQLWIRDWRLETVGLDVPSTALPLSGLSGGTQTEPANLELAR
jgi:hypothetical protein